MMEHAKTIAEWSVTALEMVGVFIIVLLALYAILLGGLRFFKKDKTQSPFHQVRQSLGQGILLGLEFLVAADIIHTVAVELTFETVGVLAIIVLVRTFLSFTLEVELTGRWPWQQKREALGSGE